MKGYPVQRYFWLAKTVFDRGPISFAEINRLWEKSALNEGNKLSKRTFHNHREAIEAIFKISIKYDELNGKYYIEDKGELGKGGLESWLLNAFSTSCILTEAKTLGSRVQLEEIPSSQRFLAELIVAMRENKCVDVTYHPYTSDEPFVLHLQPLIVKSYERRWYLYANKSDDATVKLYALDRMLQCEVLDQKFHYPEDFDAEAFTRDAIGVAVYDHIKPVAIRLRAKGDHAKYMRSLPLHHSQREVETGENYAVFEIFVAPTPELYDKLLSFRNRIKVLSPLKVRVEMHNHIANVYHLYSGMMKRTKVGRAIGMAASRFEMSESIEVDLALERLSDIRAVRNLDAALIYLEAQYGWDYVKNFKLNDAETLALFERADTEDIFIFASEDIHDRLRKGVKSIDDLVQINIDHRHQNAYPKPYDYALTQALIAYFMAYIKCHYPREFEIFLKEEDQTIRVL